MKAQGDVHLVSYRHLVLDLPAGLVNFERSLITALQSLAQLTQRHDTDEDLLRRFDSILANLCSAQPESDLENCIEFAYLELCHELELHRDLAAAKAFARQVTRWQLYEDVPGALLYLRKFFTLSLLCPQRYQPLAASIAGVRFLEGELCDEVRVDSRVPALFIGGSRSLVPSGADWCQLRRAGRKDSEGAALVVDSLLELVALHQTQLRVASAGLEGCLP